MKCDSVLLLLLIVFNSIFLHGCYYDYNRDLRNQAKISDSIIEYYTKYRKVPQSIDEMVSKGFIAESWSGYAEPPVLGSDSHYSETVYKIFPNCPWMEGDLRLLGRKRSEGSWDFLPTVNSDLVNRLKHLANTIPKGSH